MFVICLAGLFNILGGGFETKAPCVLLNQTGWCYSDIQTLYTQRDFGSHVLPYIHGGITHPAGQGGSSTVAFTGHEVEYPVLTGLFIWLTALPTHTLHQYFFVNVALLSLSGLLTVRLLHRLVGHRALLFALAPCLAWYSFLNWDLLVVGSTVAALYAWRRGRFEWSAALLAVGACLKGWPALLLVPLAMDLLSRGRRRDVFRCGAVAALIAMAANGPFMLANFGGWRAPFTFQSTRPMDASSDSLWPYLVDRAHSVLVANRLSEIACAAAFSMILAAGRFRSHREGAYPFVQVCASMVAVFVALGRVHSPQYALWVLPFFALLRVRWYWWAAFVVTDAWLFAQWSILPGWPSLLRSAVLLSDLVLCGFAWLSLRSATAFQDAPVVADRRGPVAPGRVELGHSLVAV